MSQQALRAGPLRLVLDEAAVVRVRLGGACVLRAVRLAVRDERWGTLPHRITRLEVERRARSFRAELSVVDEQGPIRFDWDAVVEGREDGTLEYRARGVARTRFRRNRIGLVVLHPVDECAGRPLRVETPDGRCIESAFPRQVAAQDPFTEIRALAWEVAPRVEAQLRFEGEVFEMEDHRNWTDYSFKTFGTPLALPAPVEVAEGSVVEQSVTLRLVGDMARTAAPPRREPRVVVSANASAGGPLPSLGTRLVPGAKLSKREGVALAQMGIAHLRADLDTESSQLEPRLRAAAESCRLAGARLEAAVFLPDPPEPGIERVARAVRASGAPIGSWLLFDAATRRTPHGLATRFATAVAGIAPGALVGVGSDLHFAELNQDRPEAGDGDFLCHTSSPQVHDADESTIVENVRSVGWMAETARAFAAGRPIAITPVTLRPAGEPPDPRQHSPLAAVWTAAHLCACLRSGIASLTYHDATGPLGLVGPDGAARPAGAALLAFGRFRGATAGYASTSNPLRVEAALLRRSSRATLVLVNVTAEPVAVEVRGATPQGGPHLSLGPREIRSLDLP